MTRLAKRTWHEARELFRPATVVILPIGSTEPHGPHLPLDADVTIAEAQAERAVELLAADGVTGVVLPALPYGLTHYAQGFEGRITLQPGTLWAVLEDIVQSLEEQNVRRIVFSNGHLEPAHVKVLRGVMGDHPEITKIGAQVIFPDNTRRRWAQTLGDEFRSGDCHAGRYESSILLAADSGAVRVDELRRLPDLRIDLTAKMKEGVQSFREAGADDAYCGQPSAASVEEGRELVDLLATMIATSVREAWPELFPERPREKG